MAFEETKFGVRPKKVIEELEYKNCIRYPRPELKYNDRSARINVVDGEGVLIIQTSGEDQDNRVNPDVVAKFQCVIMGETPQKPVEVPASSWYSVYNNVGKKPLIIEVVRNLAEFPVDQLERYAPFPAFEIVRQNGALALLPTLRVREIKSVDSGRVPYAQSTRGDSILPGWHGKVQA